jgi:hypothetical protein
VEGACTPVQSTSERARGTRSTGGESVDSRGRRSNGVKILLEEWEGGFDEAGSDTRMDEEEREEGNRRGSDAEAASSWTCCNGQPESGEAISSFLCGRLRRL